jgi:hypothetical protein
MKCSLTPTLKKSVDQNAEYHTSLKNYRVSEI